MSQHLPCPLISVVTPVYNGDKWLSECIESVLAQTHRHFEYIIMDNCSTDRSAAIAQGYALRDSRIRLHRNERFVGAIDNHNIALSRISKHSKYSKIVSADDWLYPECLARLAGVAEANPTVGIVGSYQLSGNGANWAVRWVGLPYNVAVVPGRAICRSTLLGGPYVFGVPTSTLYRSDLVRGANAFFPNQTLSADVSAFFEHLKDVDFGFVHQVLSFERIHDDALSTPRRKLGFEAAGLRDLIEYGPHYLTPDEMDHQLNKRLSEYYALLAAGLLGFQGKQFRAYHRDALEGLGYKLYCMRLANAICVKALDSCLNPKMTIEKILKRTKSRGGRSSDREVAV